MGASARLARLSKDLGQLDKVMVANAAQVVADALSQRAARDTGGDGVLSGFRGAHVKVGVVVKSAGDGMQVAPSAGSAGHWAILNSGARRHNVVARPGSSLATPWGQRDRIRGSYSPARRTWATAADVGLAAAVKVVRDEFHKVVGG